MGQAIVPDVEGKIKIYGASDETADEIVKMISDILEDGVSEEIAIVLFKSIVEPKGGRVTVDDNLVIFNFTSDS